MRSEITQTELKELLTYNTDTGLFTWNALTNPRMRSNGVAGYTRSNGYVLLKLKGRQHLAHRLAWLYVHGHFPDGLLDHIDRDPSNNRIANLRIATSVQNGGNRAINRTNTSGYRGVSYNTAARKFYAFMNTDNKNTYLGSFDTPEAASAVIEARRNELYGEFNSVFSAPRFPTSPDKGGA